MAVTFTPDQQATIDARDSSILVSAAAGSGKTAVLVERIIQMVSDTEHPVDIDRLLVVTFTNAAAAQMRERITQALSGRVDANPGNAHLLKQLTLIHNAQITTIDSFCLYIIRNHFDEIDLDPDFRVADDGEIKLLQQDVLADMLEEYFAAGDEEFLSCVEYFAPAGKEKRLEEQILGLYEFAMSYPWPGEWLTGHQDDYAVTEDSLDECSWILLLKSYIRSMLEEAKELLAMTKRLCEEPGGPYMYLDTLEADGLLIDRLLAADTLEDMYEAFSDLTFGRISSKKDESVSPEKREQAKQMRNGIKDLLNGLAKKYFSASPRVQAERMAECAPYVSRLLALTEDFRIRLDGKKREKNLMDFHDMEHMALQILTEKTPEGVQPTATALEMREFYAEIMIDEYQDSNLVQEYLLRSISGEEEGKYNRFMVGDVKQSIYKFRLARPELFMEKFDSYGKTEGKERRIDLKQNFRSRRQVTDSVNACFACMMGRDLGGVEYDRDAALYPGASFPEPEGQGEGDVYETEVLLTAAGEDGLDDREREALAIAGKIRQLTGTLPVTDKETGQLRPARYSDIVILLRTTANWDETFKKVLEECGIPVYITSKTGYFAATEVQTILNFLKVLNNPLQDIPLFGVLKSEAAGFSDEDIARMKAETGAEGRRLYTCLTVYATEGTLEELKEKSQLFLQLLDRFRRYVAYMPIHQLIEEFLKETGYLYTVSALPGGEQRRANVEMLLTRAENFEKTSYFGLFHFIRYMEQVEKYDIDYGEANVQDENADTVRIMSIHKSKGLEFPICFVAGLSKKFNMQDTMKPVIMDMDYGIALDYVDIDSRVRGSTLKKAVLSGKLRRDSLGEELRVLYVAMTRPQEKLILTGSCKDAEKVQRILDEGGAGLVTASDAPYGPGRLTFTLRSEASGYLDWLLPAWAVCEQRVQILTASELLQEQMGEEQGREQLKARLLSFEKEAGRRSAGEENEEIRLLRERMESVYPHENLKNLYTKTTVSELKKAGMEEAAQEAYHLFEEKELVPYLPRFIREEEKVSGTARGSAYHKALELFPFAEYAGRLGRKAASGAPDPAEVKAILDRMAEEGTLLKEFREAVNPGKIAQFLESSLAARMAQAAARGRLYKEQPFVLGLPAKTLDDSFPEEETVLIQGIIDVYLEEEDGLVVADYKTDSVTCPQELINRYQVQLDYYARALEQLTGKKVREKIIYSFALAAEVPLA